MLILDAERQPSSRRPAGSRGGVRRCVCLLLVMISLAACAGSHLTSSTATQIDPPGSSPLPATPMVVLSVVDSSIVVIDTATHAVVKTITHPDFSGASEFAITPDGILYVALDHKPHRAYNRMMVIDPTSGAIVADFQTAQAPQTPRWIGDHTILVGHGIGSTTGHDLVLIDTRDQTVIQQFKRPEQLVDAVAVGDMVYLLERGQPFLAAYHRTSQTMRQVVALPQHASTIVRADEQHVYLSFNGRQDLSGVPCNVSGTTIGRLNLATGNVDTLGSLRLPASPHGLAIVPDTAVIALDTCFDADHGRITVFDAVSGAERTHRIVDQHVMLTMSQVTPQGEIAVFFEDGRLHWYDAVTLEARGQTELPIRWIASIELYPTETSVRK